MVNQKRAFVEYLEADPASHATVLHGSAAVAGVGPTAAR
jgi:hypothetical protein